MRQLPPDPGGQTPAIAPTAYAREEDRTRTLTAGFQQHLTKRVEPRRLVAAVAYLARKSGDTDTESAPQTQDAQTIENADAV